MNCKFRMIKKVNNKICELNSHAQTDLTYYIVEHRLDTGPSGSRWGCRDKANGNASGGKNNRHRRRNSPKRGVQWRQAAVVPAMGCGWRQAAYDARRKPTVNGASNGDLISSNSIWCPSVCLLT